MGENEQGHGRTAAQAGWHASRYNLMARVPGSKNVAIANLFRGTCAEYTPIELYLLSVLDEIDEHHPIIDRLSRRGVVVNFDELAAVETLGRAACAAPGIVSLTICPTMGCNFDCPYCFENHRAGKMSREVQDDVVALAERMLEASGVRRLAVTWFGGEPLLFPDVIESLSGENYEATGVAIARRADGEAFRIEIHASCNRDSDGNVIGAVLSLSDLTERDRVRVAEQNVETLRAAFARLHDTYHALGNAFGDLESQLQELAASADPATAAKAESALGVVAGIRSLKADVEDVFHAALETAPEGGARP